MVFTPTVNSEATPVVMKFGGSSVADFERLTKVAAIIEQRARERPTVVVVSAMGKTTDGLVRDARRLCDPPAARELDMLLTTGERTSMALLALALHGRGVSAISLTGSQCGVITDHQHGRARIVEVRPFRIVDELAAGHVVVVGGFQGVSYKREVTTLGRGGSDTSAVALAAALGADCEIYSDVDGVYDADPRVVPEAARMDAIDYAQMQALSRAGASVLHSRAVELAAERGIAIYARASFPTGGAGQGQTVIRNNPAAPSGVRAVSCDAAVLDVELRLREPASPAVVAQMVAALGGLGLRYLQVDARGARGLLSTTTRDDAGAIESTLGALAQSLDQSFDQSFNQVDGLSVRGGRSLVTLVGAALEERPDTVAAALEILTDAGIFVLGVRTDGQSLGLLVSQTDGAAATRALHALIAG